MIATAVRLVFEQPDQAAARSQLDGFIDTFAPRFPRVAELLADAEPDLLAPRPSPLRGNPRRGQLAFEAGTGPVSRSCRRW